MLKVLFNRIAELADGRHGHYGKAHLRSLFGLGEPDETTARVLGTIAAEPDLTRDGG